MKKNLSFLQVSIVIAFFGTAAVMAQTNAIYVDSQGKVGIGTNTPSVPLHVITTNAPSNTVIQFENNAAARLRFRNSANGETWNLGHQSPSGTGFVISDVGDAVTEFRIDVSGNVVIAGTLTAGNPPGTFPDYVFSPDYALMPLDKLADFVREKRHLPNLPAREQVATSGQINMTEFQYQLLEKVEELTLYTLQQQRRIDELSTQIKELRQQREEIPVSQNR
jgi:hypothetical protein